MELKWLEDFISVANTGNFSRSANERNVTQPAFSRRIRALEFWLGAELVDRSTYPTTLTPAGRIFRGTAEEVLRLLAQQRDEFRAEQNRGRAALRFAALHTISTAFFPNWLRQMEQSTGSLATRVVPGNFSDCVESLSEGDCDFMLCFAHEAVPMTLDPAEFLSCALAREHLVPVAHPDAGITGFPGTTEKPIRFLSYSGHCFLGRIVDHLLRSNPEHHFEIFYENTMAESLKSMALSGYGAAWLPLSIIKTELEQGSLQRLAGKDWELPLDIRLYRSANRLRPIAATLWDHAQSLNRSDTTGSNTPWKAPPTGKLFK